MRQYAYLAIVAILVISCSAPGSSSSDSGKVFHLKYGSPNPATNLGDSDVIKTLLDQVAAKSGGRLIIDPFYGGQLGNDATLMASVESGTLDMALSSDATMATIEPSFNVIELPFFWKDQQAVNKIVIEGPIGKELLAKLASKGMKGLALVSLGPRAVISNFPINSVSDVKGRKIRVVPNALFTSMWQGWGAVPVAIATTEVFPALQTKAIEGLDSNPTGMVSFKWYQAAKYLALTNHEFTTEVITMNLKLWNSLPSDLQDLITSGIQMGVALNLQNSQAAVDGAVSTMQQFGLQVIHPDPSTFRDQSQSVWTAYRASIGASLIDEAQTLQASSAASPSSP